jgi:hypothetical protein
MGMEKSNMKMRILIIEDDPDREEKLRSWLPVDIKVVVARGKCGNGNRYPEER